MSHLDIIISIIISHFCSIAFLSLPDVYKVSMEHLPYHLLRAWEQNSGFITSGLVTSFFTSTLEESQPIRDGFSVWETDLSLSESAAIHYGWAPKREGNLVHNKMNGFLKILFICSINILTMNYMENFLCNVQNIDFSCVLFIIIKILFICLFKSTYHPLACEACSSEWHAKILTSLQRHQSAWQEELLVAGPSTPATTWNQKANQRGGQYSNTRRLNQHCRIQDKQQTPN